jgi:cytochrome P450
MMQVSLLFPSQQPTNSFKMDIDASSPFSKAFDYASDHVALRFQNPLYYITEFFNGAKFRESVTEVKKFGRHIVNDAKRRRSRAAFESLIDNEDVVFGSLVDSLIEVFRNPAVVADSAMNFLSAGRDTTAQSFTWTFYALMRHADVLQKLRKEADEQAASINGTHVADLQPANVPYTMAVYYEALRLYPPVPVEIKQCETEVTLPDGTFMPKDSIIVWCIWAMNRSQTLYGDDAQRFRPERWLNAEGQFTSKTAFEFPVFNGGPRSCLGKKMAELMGAYLIINLVKDFDFEEVRNAINPEKERSSQNSLTLPMQDGLPCKVRKREH